MFQRKIRGKTWFSSLSSLWKETNQYFSLFFFWFKKRISDTDYLPCTQPSMGKRELCETSQLWSTEHKRTNAKETLMYNFKNKCEGFIWVSKHKKTGESTRLHRPRAFIVLDCLETLMKPNAQVLEITSQSRLRNKKKMEIFQFFTCCQLITCCHSN